MDFLNVFKSGKGNPPKEEKKEEVQQEVQIDYAQAIKDIEKEGKRVKDTIDSYSKYEYEDKRVFKTPVNFAVLVTKFLLGELQKKDKVIEELKREVAGKDDQMKKILERVEEIEKQLNPKMSRRDSGHVGRL